MKDPFLYLSTNLLRLGHIITNNKAVFVLLAFIFSLPHKIDSQEISYHPNKHWTVRADAVKPNTQVEFHYFNPQYGYPQRNLAGKSDYEEWESWKEKNHFSYKYKLEGHVWQAVIANHKEIFQKHPDYLSQVNGKRPGYGVARKLCVSNKNVQELFIKDRIEAFKKLNDPEGSVSVEPSDGAGFCECSNCKKLGSISNQVFFLANLTAARLREKFPKGKVNLYAYNKHAELPDFDIEPNVHVTVIPAGFQSVYDGDVMMSLWAKKVKLKTYYEYFTIPQQKAEQPRIYIQDFLDRMNLARKLGYQGYWFETGVNINSAIALVLFNQLWLDSTLTWEIVSARFLRSCFRDSYTPMKRLFGRWWHTWLGDQEYPAALYDLNEASRLATSPDEQERINDLKAYVHYLILYSQWDKNRQNARLAQNLFDYMYQSRSRVIVNGPALYEVFKSLLNKAQQERYNWRTKANIKYWPALTEKTIRENFIADQKNYKPQSLNFNFVPIVQGVKSVRQRAEPLQSFRLNCRKMGDKIRVYSEGPINIKLINFADHGNYNDKKLLLSVMDTDGNVFYNDFILYSKPNLKLNLPSQKVYIISLLQYFRTEIEITGKVIPIVDKEQLSQVKSTSRKNVARKSLAKEDALTHYYFLAE